MRDLTKKEISDLFDRGRCTFCSSMILMAGPEGGISQNVICDGCGAKYNVTPIRGFNCQLINGPLKKIRQGSRLDGY